MRAADLARLSVAPLALLMLVTGVAGGLLRAGVGLPGGPWAATAVGGHAFLMLCGFFATVVSLERAVALARPVAWAAPMLSSASGLALLAGRPAFAMGLGLGASCAFLVAHLRLVREHDEPHTRLLRVSACAWLAGDLMIVVQALLPGASAAVPSFSGSGRAPIAAWFAFLVITVAAERLELTRLMPRRRHALASLRATVALLLVGALLTAWRPAAGGVLVGLALCVLAAWLATFDIARRTLRAPGLPRYMAACLLAGYAWLALAGVAWLGSSLGCPEWDLALHALALGFLFGMVLGHAPVILPALAPLRIRFGVWFYAPLIVLHASLVLRLLVAPWLPGLYAPAVAGNACALALFALTLAVSARLRRPRA